MPNDAQDQLFDFYKLLSPQDLLGNLRTDYRSYTLNKNLIIDVTNCYIDKAVSGDEIVRKLQNQNLSDDKKNVQSLAYCTMHQPKNNLANNELISPDYWQYTNVSDPRQVTPLKNLQAELFESAPDEIKQNVAVTLNVLRTPLVSMSKKNVNEITTFLNHIPSYFASQMVPYFDVEFQTPVNPFNQKNDSGRDYNKLLYTNKPSLLRFLEGTRAYGTFALTDADQSLLQVFPTPTRSNPDAKSVFTGMEMFTSPQTLTNMNSLKADSAGNVRLNDAQPFLPPASVVGASISIANAGAGAFAHKRGKLTIKVHDKARIAEFAELFRGPAGYRNVKVWLTYGWLAPRGRGENDVYAKFINYNMLVKEAFTIYNSSYNFEATGEVTVDLDLVTAGISTLDTTTLGAASSVQSTQRAIADAIEAVQQANEILNEEDEAPFKDIRIFQILASTAVNDLEPDVKGEELKKLIDQNKKFIDQLTEKANLDKAKIELIKKGFNSLKELYTGADGGLTSARRKRSIEFVNDKFKKCRSGRDPFMLDAKKREIFKKVGIQLNTNLAKELDTYELQAPNRSTNIEKTIQLQQGKKNLVSFGKIFSSFCMPAILEAAERDNIDEVQVNFYMLNESCGPISLCNIAEFPIDIRKFEQQFIDVVDQRGGDDFTIEEFLQFVVQSQFNDERSPGYGMYSSYEPYDGKENSDPKRTGSEAQQSAAVSKWFSTYGIFKKPSIAVKIETLESGAPASGKSDLLLKLGRSASEVYKTKQPEGKNIIKKIHIYDKTLNAYYGTSRALKLGQGPGARWVAVNEAETSTTQDASRGIVQTMEAKKAADPRIASYSAETTVTVQTNEDGTVSQVTTQGNLRKPKQSNGSDIPGPSATQTVTARTLPNGKRILAELVGATLPTIIYGSQGTMVTSAQIASKTDGLQGTINMQGGVKGKRSSVSDTGLAMETGNLPLQVLPAQLSITSMGCPLAELYQQFFFDFNTGTTLDNLYNCTAITHNFSPGKFETAWTFLYTDGYGKLHGAPSVKDFFEKLPKQ